MYILCVYVYVCVCIQVHFNKLECRGKVVPFTQNALLWWQTCDLASGIGKTCKKMGVNFLTWAQCFYKAVSCMRCCKRHECNSQTCPCLHRKDNGKAAQSNKKPVKNYYWMSNISCLHNGDSWKLLLFYRTFIINNSLLVLYLQSFWITLTFEIF